VLTFYGDASSNEADAGTPIMVVSGFISSAKLWSEFERRWAKVLERYGIAYFRMSEFAGCRGQFEGWRERESDRREFLRRAIDIIRDIAWGSFAAGVLKDDWNLCNQDYELEERSFMPYPLCAWACVDLVRRWSRGERGNRPYRFEEIMFVLEEGDADQAAFVSLAKKDFETIVRPEPKIPKNGTPPIGALQAADFAAWHVRNALNRYDMGTLERFREDFEMLFEAVPYRDHAHFGMKPIAVMPKNKLVRMSTQNKADEAVSSLVRFCQDRGIRPRK